MTRDRSREKRLEYLRAVGLAGYVPAGPVGERIRFLHDQRGVTFDVIAERTAVDCETIRMHYRGVNKRGQVIQSCTMATERKVLGARLKPEDGAWFPVVGIRRRLQGLSALGYTTPFLAAELPISDFRVLHKILSGRKARKTVKAGFASAVVAVYDKLADTDPVDAGVAALPAARCRTFARRRGYAPPSCWDEDTIDDPGAFPEWTGRCGTVFGWRIHQVQGIPICRPCVDVRGESAVELSGELLRHQRVSRGLSQEQLARLAGIKVDQYRSWERDRTKPRYEEQLDLVLVALNVTYDQVAREKE